MSKVVDGFPSRALGNSVVPQCAEVIGWVIRELCDIALRAVNAELRERGSR